MNSMKRIIYWAALILPLLAGCTKPSSYPDAPAPEQYDRYIFFSHGVETKASLIESAADLDGKAFGVVGFKYDAATTWSAVKDDATPNVFYDEDPDAAGTYSLTDVETVSVSADGTNTTVGVGSYTPLQGWSNSKKYSFFAYYPVGNQYVSLVNLGKDSNYNPGVPAIKYTMDLTNGESFTASMVDVMTATAHEDLYWKSVSDKSESTSANGEVYFSFNHCLSCLGLNLKNSTAGSITVDSVTFHLTGLQYQSITIPLDGSAKTPTGSSTDIDCALQVGEGGVAIPSVSNDSDGVELTDKLILIPQTVPLTFTVTVGYTRSLEGYTDNTTSFTTGDLSTSLEGRKKYIVNLKFTDSTVDVGFKSGAWAERHTIDNTFN